MTVEIDIDDLRAPRLSDAQRAALAYGDATPIELTEQAVLSTAQQRTGLNDFGAGDFRERLNLLLSLWNADQDISNLHRLTLFGYAARHATNRLLIHDLLKRHPEIHDERIDRPIIVAGLPRSGTTHLVNLLAADPRLRSLPLWKFYEPIPIPGERAGTDGVDPRYQRCADAWDQMRETIPLLAAMHPMEPDHAHEELELMGPDFASYNYEWISHAPDWRNHYYASDQTPHYEYLKTVLKILQWVRGPRRWVLKCPQHLEQLPVLRTVFPDATVAITHRDPVAVIQSAVTMIAYGERIYRKKIEPEMLIAYWSERIDHLLRACVRDRAVWPESQSVDVLFHEFMADDLTTAEVILEKAGLPMTGDSRHQVAGFLEAHPRGKEGRMIYHLKRDFGVDPDDLRHRFQFYFDAFAVKAEGRKEIFMTPLIGSLGDVMQIAFVPEDFGAAVQYWTKTMGVGPFFRLDHAQNGLTRTTFRGKPCLADYSLMLAYWGDIQVELIQQHNDAPSIYSEWRNSGSEGLHHVCILADDLDHVKKVCFAAGSTLLQDGDSDAGNFAYFDTKGGPGTTLEVLCPRPEVRAYQEHMKQVARSWDGSDPIRAFGV